MYGDDIDGTTLTVGFEAMTALKRDGSALIPASLVNVLKGNELFTFHYIIFYRPRALDKLSQQTQWLTTNRHLQRIDGPVTIT